MKKRDIKTFLEECDLVKENDSSANSQLSLYEEEKELYGEPLPDDADKELAEAETEEEEEEEEEEGAEEAEGQLRGRFKRFINYRFFFFVLIFVLMAILAGSISDYSFFLSYIIILGIVLGLLISIVKVGGAKIKHIGIIVALIAAVASYSFYIYEVHSWVPSDFESGAVYDVSGSVCGNVAGLGRRIVVIDDVRLDSKKVSGKLRIYVDSDEGFLEFCRLGDIISFSGRVTATDLKTNYRKNQRFYASVEQSDIKMEIGSPSLLQSIRMGIRAALEANLPKEYAEISYAMLTGDTDNLPLEISQYFRTSGIAHVLAVSGLHINFLLMLLIFPLRGIRVKRLAMFVIVVFSMLGYAAIADFSPSVIRAVIMGTIGLAVKLKGKENDSFNNLCCAACIILVFKPHYAFDVGFLLSMTACFGIVLFFKPLVKVLKKLRIPRALNQPIALMLSVQIGMLPVSIYYFNSFSLYSFVANILLYYVIMATFMLLVIGVLICYFFPQFGVLIRLSGAGLMTIDSIAQFVASLPYAKIAFYTLSPIFICYLLYFVASRFVRKDRFALLTSAVALVIALSLALSLNYSYDLRNTITPVVTPYYDVTSIVTLGSSTYIIGDVQSAHDLTRNLFSIRARRIDAVFISALNEKTAYQLLQLESSFSGFTIYFPLTKNISGLDLLLGKFTLVGIEESSFITNGIRAEFGQERFLCYRLIGIQTAIFLPISVDFSSLPIELRESADLVRSFSAKSNDVTTLTNETSYSINENKNIILMQETKTLIYNLTTNKGKLVRLV